MRWNLNLKDCFVDSANIKIHGHNCSLPQNVYATHLNNFWLKFPPHVKSAIEIDEREHYWRYLRWHINFKKQKQIYYKALWFFNFYYKICFKGFSTIVYSWKILFSIIKNRKLSSDYSWKKNQNNLFFVCSYSWFTKQLFT